LPGMGETKFGGWLHSDERRRLPRASALPFQAPPQPHPQTKAAQQLTVAQVRQLMQTRSCTKAHTQAAPSASASKSKAHSGSSYSSSSSEESKGSTSDSG